MIIFMHNICNSLLKLEEWVLSLLFGLWWKNYVCTAICGYDKVSWNICMYQHIQGEEENTPHAASYHDRKLPFRQLFIVLTLSV